MNTKLVLAIFGVALIAAALIGVTAAQYGNTQNPTQTAQTHNQTGSNCVNGDETVCVSNGTCTNSYCNDTCTCTREDCNNTCINEYCNQTRESYGYNGTDTGAVQNQNQNEYCNGYGYGCTEQNQNAYGYGAGVMGQVGYGYGRCR
jgi:hypothetical protein